jgi:Zn-dependent protease with chaperone function
MRRTCLTVLVCLSVLTAIAPLILAQEDSPERDPALEQEIYDRLVAINPDAVPVFQQATQAMDADDLMAAKQGYEQVLDLAPDFPDALRRLSYVELGLGNVESGFQACETLVEVRPDYPFAHYVVGMLAAEGGKWERAERELLLAQELGMEAEEIQQALNDGIASQARLYRWLRRGGYTVAGWLVGMGVLFVVGMVLSRLTLAAVQRARPDAQFEVGRGERIVRAVYRVVIALTSAYFYVSIPFVILIVVAAAAGVFYLFFAMGRIPVRLAAILAITTIYTLIAIVRSVFTRAQDQDPGQLLSREEAPELYALAVEVADRVGTRPVDAVYVTPASEIGVKERGSLPQKLRGAGQRCLILGLGALPGMTQSQLKAILAHEYGHFSNCDTAGGNLARQVGASIHRMVYGLAINGLARWYNPAWLFVNGFNRVFLRVTLGASRLQEILADRYAVLAYGVRNFVDGLTHIVHQSIAFNVQVTQEVRTAVGEKRTLQNLYLLPPIQSDSLKEELETKVDEAMNRLTSPYDSHPAVQERIRLLHQLEVADIVEESQKSVWDLLPNAEKLQSEMTAVVQGNVQKQQLRIA